MIVPILMLFVALCLSGVAAYYSVVGLTLIFAAAVVPVLIMGSVLEVAKLTVTLWLHDHGAQCNTFMKTYLTLAVIVLMMITSIGIFGFLSRAHSTQSAPTMEIIAKIEMYDEKIKVHKENIQSAKSALTQMDIQVNELMNRSNDVDGATKASNLRRMQKRERQSLQSEIELAQSKVNELNVEKAPLSSELRKANADVGPLRYIAALLYGDNTTSDMLEDAVRLVIVILVMVFDPLAVMMLLAATKSIGWYREKKSIKPVHSEPEPTPPQKQKRKYTKKTQVESEPEIVSEPVESVESSDEHVEPEVSLISSEENSVSDNVSPIEEVSNVISDDVVEFAKPSVPDKLTQDEIDKIYSAKPIEEYEHLLNASFYYGSKTLSGTEMSSEYPEIWKQIAEQLKDKKIDGVVKVIDKK